MDLAIVTEFTKTILVAYKQVLVLIFLNTVARQWLKLQVPNFYT